MKDDKYPEEAFWDPLIIDDALTGAEIDAFCRMYCVELDKSIKGVANKRKAFIEKFNALTAENPVQEVLPELQDDGKFRHSSEDVFEDHLESLKKKRDQINRTLPVNRSSIIETILSCFELAKEREENYWEKDDAYKPAHKLLFKYAYPSSKSKDPYPVTSQSDIDKAIDQLELEHAAWERDCEADGEKFQLEKEEQEAEREELLQNAEDLVNAEPVREDIPSPKAAKATGYTPSEDPVARLMERQIEIFLDISLKTLDKTFAWWVNSNLILLALASEKETAKVVADLIYDRNNTPLAIDELLMEDSE